MSLIVVTPAKADKPVPVMIMFRGGQLPGPPGSPALDFFGRPMPPPGPGEDPPGTEQLIEAGWGYAFLNPSSVQADNGAGLTKGIIGLVNKGQRRKPDDWGSLRAWGWGASRALDFFETDKTIDAKRVGIDGVSRYGKAALVTMAFDQRFAVVLIGSSGEGGAKLHRRNFGEAVENLTASGQYHWMAGNFLKYGASEATFGSKNAERHPGRRAPADRAVRAAADVRQLRRAREGRRAVARSAGQLHGGGRRAAGLPPARRQGSRAARTTTRPRRCRR